MERQLLTVSIVIACVLNDHRFAGQPGEECAEHCCYADAAIALALERGYCEVDAAPATDGAVLAPCFAPAFVSLVMSRHFQAWAPIPCYRPPPPPTAEFACRMAQAAASAPAAARAEPGDEPPKKKSSRSGAKAKYPGRD